MLCVENQQKYCYRIQNKKNLWGKKVHAHLQLLFGSLVYAIYPSAISMHNEKCPIAKCSSNYIHSSYTIAHCCYGCHCACIACYHFKSLTFRSCYTNDGNNTTTHLPSGWLQYNHYLR